MAEEENAQFCTNAHIFLTSGSEECSKRSGTSYGRRFESSRLKFDEVPQIGSKTSFNTRSSPTTSPATSFEHSYIFHLLSSATNNGSCATKNCAHAARNFTAPCSCRFKWFKWPPMQSYLLLSFRRRCESKDIVLCDSEKFLVNEC